MPLERFGGINVNNDPLKAFPGNFGKDSSCVGELGVKI
jgi:hypothetical protein